ncbi:hypothetical protein Poli38472_004847 [Pythium oligandrum]|uniref:M96 mating-specific protein family n=1 Tax=Pythium oligandrum TaxID=41045 RepID=A0A8K1CB67_PYTOL|nr:hypothetical protein Poli38472_004847 [Pythium oligandrum]|eukprot:TMW59778.1 hypothetical protein Poli38472_004847 [Pythium oligandrum]
MTTLMRAYSAAQGQEAPRGHEDMVIDPTLSFLDEMEGLPALVDTSTDPGSSSEDLTEELLREMLIDPDVNALLADGHGKKATRALKRNGKKPRSERYSPTKVTKPTSQARQKEEVDYLRRQVQELEAELNKLQQNHGAEAASQGALSVTSGSKAAVWKGLAERQRDAKQKAEVENVKLKEMLEDQLKIASSLEKLVRKRLGTEANEWGNMVRMSSFLPADSPESIFSSITESMESCAVEVEAFLRECGLDEVSGNFKDIKSRCGDRDDLFLEIQSCRELPFPMQATADTVWYAVNAKYMDTHGAASGSVRPLGNLYHLHFTINKVVRRSDVAVDVYAISKREDHANRVIIKWESRAFLSSSVFREKRVRMREHGCMIIQRDPAQPASSSLIKSCVRSWPEIDESAPTIRQFELIVDLLIGSYNDNMQAMYQMVENSLLDTALSQQQC